MTGTVGQCGRCWKPTLWPLVSRASQAEIRGSFSPISWTVSGVRLKGEVRKLLSTGGKEVLFKAVIQSIPSYAMSLFRLPKSLTDEIHRLSARFWWGGNERSRKMHWCTWKRLCKRKMDGGLGFRDLEVFNRALIAKQCWRIFKNPDSLASGTLKGCYFPDCGFLEATKKASGSFLWNILLWGKGILDKGLRWRVENGTSIRVYKG
ncbi:hypothetical protein Dsin_006249 [Dipteronia sinensis]|uniref:Uncharacterized protein n=1 Tax=Dipteronia sinensis TaxID=43782 RepID=A0AAE0EFY7_9ROSI|nr:hypothetical protein Dsin_006249 [Dipteronia sinensis]